MASPYIKPPQNSVNFNWTNDTYAENSFNSFSQIQMIDGISSLSFLETVGLSDNLPQLKNKYITNITETIGLSDNMYSVFLLKFIETMGLHDDFSIAARMNALFQESIGIQDNINANSKVLLVFNEKIALTDSLNVGAILNIKLQETIGLKDYIETYTDFDGIPIQINNRDTYSMNFSNGAFSRYDSKFNFSGNIKFKGKYFILNGNGLYENTGLLDEETKITSGIKTGLIRFGGDVQSRIDYAFLAIKNDGLMSVKLIGSDGLEKVYALTGTSETLKDKRVQFGKGDGSGGARRCTYFQFEITSQDNFELDNLAVYKLALSRKT